MADISISILPNILPGVFNIPILFIRSTKIPIKIMLNILPIPGITPRKIYNIITQKPTICAVYPKDKME